MKIISLKVKKRKPILTKGETKKAKEKVGLFYSLDSYFLHAML